MKIICLIGNGALLICVLIVIILLFANMLRALGDFIYCPEWMDLIEAIASAAAGVLGTVTFIILIISHGVFF